MKNRIIYIVLAGLLASTVVKSAFGTNVSIVGRIQTEYSGINIEDFSTQTSGGTMIASANSLDSRSYSAVNSLVRFTSGTSEYVSVNSINVSASEASSSKVITLGNCIQQDNFQAKRQHQTHKQTQLRQQMKPKKNKKFQRTNYPMFP